MFTAMSHECQGHDFKCWWDGLIAWIMKFEYDDKKYISLSGRYTEKEWQTNRPIDRQT